MIYEFYLYIYSFPILVNILPFPFTPFHYHKYESVLSYLHFPNSCFYNLHLDLVSHTCRNSLYSPLLSYYNIRRIIDMYNN